MFVTPSGKRVDIEQSVAACVSQTRLFSPEELAWMIEIEPPRIDSDTQTTVQDASTLDACCRLVRESDRPVFALNFASAKNPGGGFIGGSQAQEESIARSSGLYPALQSQHDYYDINRACGTAMYTDHMILSPEVPVFRDNTGCLLEQPYPITVLTAPAVNAGAIRRNEPERTNEIVPTMRRRVAMVLAIAAQNGYRRLVLGAWGCGVFRNDPAQIADLFAEQLLNGGPYTRSFETVIFAVLAHSDTKIITPFRERLAAGAST